MNEQDQEIIQHDEQFRYMLDEMLDNNKEEVV